MNQRNITGGGRRENIGFASHSPHPYLRPSGFLGNLNQWVLDETDTVKILLSMKQGDITVDITE